MNKVTAAIVLTLLFGAQHAWAQSYPYYQTQTSYQSLSNSGSCVSISRNLSLGSRGSDVLSLQQFILTRNYPGSGSWMLTGYYGTATRAGVIDFQIDARLPQTGIVDGATRSALMQSCGSGYTQPTPTYPSYTPTYSNTYPWNNVQPWYDNSNNIYGNNSNGTCGWYTVGGQSYFNNCGFNNPNNTVYPNNNNYPYNNYGGANSPTISNVSGPTSINVNTTGTWIISINNTYNSNYSSISVDWGDPVFGAYLSAPQQVYSSQSATFTHAYTQSGTYTVRFTVSNSYGSNTSSVTVQVNNASNNNGTPWISSINPTYGSVGTQIVIYGSGFNGDNTVHFGNGGIAHVTSASGNYIYFTVPSSLTPCTVQTNGSTGCPQYAQQVTPGQYPIYVTTNGNNSNSLTFTVQ
jgi:hypothetical protein